MLCNTAFKSTHHLQNPFISRILKSKSKMEYSVFITLVIVSLVAHAFGAERQEPTPDLDYYGYSSDNEEFSASGGGSKLDEEPTASNETLPSTHVATVVMATRGPSSGRGDTGGDEYYDEVEFGDHNVGGSGNNHTYTTTESDTTTESGDKGEEGYLSDATRPIAVESGSLLFGRLLDQHQKARVKTVLQKTWFRHHGMEPLEGDGNPGCVLHVDTNGTCDRGTEGVMTVIHVTIQYPSDKTWLPQLLTIFNATSTDLRLVAGNFDILSHDDPCADNSHIEESKEGSHEGEVPWHWILLGCIGGVVIIATTIAIVGIKRARNNAAERRSPQSNANSLA